MPKSGNKFLEIQRTWDNAVEKNLRQLEAQGEAINGQRMLIQLLMSKFLTDVVFQLEKSKEPTDSWTMETLRKAISQYVAVQENVYHHTTSVRSQQKSANHQQVPVYRYGINTRGHSDQQQGSTDVFSNLSENRKLRPCIFCKGEHYNDECDRIATALERKQKLSQQRRCFICLKQGHVMKDCSSLQKLPCKSLPEICVCMADISSCIKYCCML